MSIQKHSRCFADERDLKHMSEMLSLSLAANPGGSYWHSGDLWWRYFLLTVSSDASQNIRLWEGDGDGELIGFAWFDPRDTSFDIQVHPAYRLHYVGDEMLMWIRGRASRMFVLAGHAAHDEPFRHRRLGNGLTQRAILAHVVIVASVEAMPLKKRDALLVIIARTRQQLTVRLAHLGKAARPSQRLSSFADERRTVSTADAFSGLRPRS